MNNLKRSMKRQRFAARQWGVGIVELMVAMLVGSIVVLGVVQIFTANRITFRMQDAMAVTQESGTFALDFIVRDVLRAGFPGDATSVAFDLTAGNTTNGAAGGNDSLAIVYSPAVSGNLLCTGAASGAALFIRNRYFVDGNRNLQCEGSVGTPGAFVVVGAPTTLVDNVDGFQVMFGVDLEHDRDSEVAAGPGCPDSLPQPTAWVNAAALGAAIARGAAPPACKAAMGPLDVVRAVRIALLVRTPNTIDATVPLAQTYTLLDTVLGTPTIAPNDGRMRRLFTSTVSLRNGGDVL